MITMVDRANYGIDKFTDEVIFSIVDDIKIAWQNNKDPSDHFYLFCHHNCASGLEQLPIDLLEANAFTILQNASRLGNITVLKWWSDNGLKIVAVPDTLIDAITLKYDEIIKWWFQHGIKLNFNIFSMYHICQNKDYLKLLFEYGLENKLEDNVIKDLISVACRLDKLIILQYLLDYNYDLNIYKEYIVEKVFMNGDLKVLEWCYDNISNLKCTSEATYLAYDRGHYTILPWWLEHNLEFEYGEDIIDMLSGKGNIEMLQWWLDSGFELKYTEKAMDNASKNGKIETLQWWLDSGLELKYSECAIDFASANGKIKVLQWWLDSGLELKYTEKAIDDAPKNGKNEVLQWWLDSGLKLKYTNEIILSDLK